MRQERKAREAADAVPAERLSAIEERLNDLTRQLAKGVKAIEQMNGAAGRQQPMVQDVETGLPPTKEMAERPISRPEMETERHGPREAVDTGLPPNLHLVSSLQDNDSGYSLVDAEAQGALRRAEERHFWFKARNEFIAFRLRALGIGSGSSIVDLGCGAGCVTAYLARLGYRLTGVEGHLPLARVAAARAPSADFIAHDLARGFGALRLQNFDAVALFDVLEHLDDPRQALENALPLAKPGGWLVGTVPALMRLWTEVDRVSGHRLRFEARQLSVLLDAVPGASAAEVVPFNRLLVPLLLLQRRRLARRPQRALVENFRIPRFPVNQALHAALRLERVLSPLFDRTFLPGASLWFALRRER